MKRRDDVAGKGRMYEHPETGHQMPSVTNVLGVIAKEALIPWAAKLERELVVTTAERVFSTLNGNPVLPEDFRKRLEFALPQKKAHKLALEDAADIGTEAHALIEWRIKGELGLERGEQPELSEPARWAVAGFEDWRKEVKLKASHAELRLWSKELDAAGSTDAICCELDVFMLAPEPRRIVAVADWKSSKAIWPEMEIQVAAYRHMAIERGLIDEKAWGLVLRLPKTLKDPKFEARLLQPSLCREHVEVFKAARRIWKWKHA